MTAARTTLRAAAAALFAAMLAGCQPNGAQKLLDRYQRIVAPAGPDSFQMETGTATAIARSGHWLTAWHLVAACRRIDILLADGAALHAALIHRDERLDVALLRTEPVPGALALQRADPEPGSRAMAVGFPQLEFSDLDLTYVGRARLLPARAQPGAPAASAPIWVTGDRAGGQAGAVRGLSGGPVVLADGRLAGMVVVSGDGLARRNGPVGQADEAQLGVVPGTLREGLVLVTVGGAEIEAFVDAVGLDPERSTSPALPAGSLARQDALRTRGLVGQVVCDKAR